MLLVWMRACMSSTHHPHASPHHTSLGMRPCITQVCALPCKAPARNFLLQQQQGPQTRCVHRPTNEPIMHTHGLFICFTCLHVPYSTVTLLHAYLYLTSRSRLFFVQQRIEADPESSGESNIIKIIPRCNAAVRHSFICTPVTLLIPPHL
jgi:hypothetical protein